MNESSAPAASPILGGKAAWCLGAMLLAGVAAMLALAAIDQGRRPTLETMEEVTAVGDRTFLKLPADPTTPVEVLWNGQTLQVDAGSRQELRDTFMRRTGRDETTGVSIYEYRGPAPTDAPAAGTPRTYLKIAPGEYVTAPRLK